MKSLLWITDAHLDHLSDTVKDAWFEKLEKTQADMLLLGGDTANSRVFSRMLGRIEEVFPGKVALVAGNHDYYHTSIADFRAELAVHHRSGVIVFESRCQSQPLQLAEGVYLCGSGGWGDATAGCADAAGMELNDEHLIAELRTGSLTARLRELGKESAEHLQQQLAAVPEGARRCFLRDRPHACPSLAGGHLARGAEFRCVGSSTLLLAGGRECDLASSRTDATDTIYCPVWTHPQRRHLEEGEHDLPYGGQRLWTHSSFRHDSPRQNGFYPRN